MSYLYATSAFQCVFESRGAAKSRQRARAEKQEVTHPAESERDRSQVVLNRVGHHQHGWLTIPLQQARTYPQLYATNGHMPNRVRRVSAVRRRDAGITQLHRLLVGSRHLEQQMQWLSATAQHAKRANGSNRIVSVVAVYGLLMRTTSADIFEQQLL